jgi:hypothetical protein
MRTHTEEVDRAVLDARLWGELIDKLIARGESLDEAIGVADRLIQARHLMEEDDSRPTEPPLGPATPGGEEPLG